MTEPFDFNVVLRVSGPSFFLVLQGHVVDLFGSHVLPWRRSKPRFSRVILDLKVYSKPPNVLNEDKFGFIH